MGIFSFFNRKKKDNKQSNENRVVPSRRSLLNNPIQSFNIHPDIKDLIWIENGLKKNFFPTNNKQEEIKVGNITITFSITDYEEPSLIDMNLELKQVKKHRGWDKSRLNYEKIAEST